MSFGLPDRFVDRERELAQLEEAWVAPRARLITIWGRRRVGKSALLARFASGKRAFYLYGSRVTEQAILARLALQAAEIFDEPFRRSLPFPSWDDALDYLAARARDERLLIIFDEFPYLCDITQGLDTLVQRWWDQFHHRANMLVIVAGSAFSFMRGLTGAQGALHGRRTGQLDLRPFDYFDAARFFPHLTASERIRAYACFGGIPAYLAYWDESAGLAETIQQTLLSPRQVLFSEGEELLRTEFHLETMYASILQAVASGQERPSDIARAVGRHSADEIFDHLRRLQELHFLRRDVPVTEWDRPRTHRALYRLSDPYLRFWYRFVAPYQAFLQLGQTGEIWTREIAPRLDEFIGRTTWEEVVMQHLWRRQGDKRLPALFAQLGRWWNGSDEIDVVGLWNGRTTVVGECKWSATLVGEGVLLALQQKARKLPLDDRPLWVLASRSGFEPALRRRAELGDVLLLTPDDLF